MITVSVEEVQFKLAELICKLAMGEEVVITENNQPIAQLTGLISGKPRPIPGRCKGMLSILAEDNDHLKDWVDYMP